MTIQAYLDKTKFYVDSAMDKLLPTDKVEPITLHQAMRYSALGPGKRIRPLLVFLGAKLNTPSISELNVESNTPHWECLAPIAAAVEFIHAYSLIHDDLPAMDDDDLRRGRPTCHKAFDEAIAILAGDSLLTLAFEVLSDYEHPDVGPDLKLRMVRALAHAAGTQGMAGGQAIDYAMSGQKMKLIDLENMHLKKTGALIQVSLLLGALGSGLDSEESLDALLHYGRLIGLSFQVQDDILDVTGTTEQLGKPQGSDEKHEKSTYPALVGLDESIKIATNLTIDAKQALACFGPEADPLRALADYITQREF